MPWVVEISREPHYPPVCPFCVSRAATRTVPLAHSQATGFFGVMATYANTRFAIPSCDACAALAVRLRFLASILLFVPWLIWFVLPFLESPTVAEVWPSLAVAPALMTVAAGGVYTFHAWRRAAFRVLHTGEEGITFGFRSETYARAFATVNGTSATWKLVVVKLA